MKRVYRLGLREPIHGQELVYAQLRAAHAYRNDLIAIERGRRSALRAIEDTEEVQEAAARVKAATRSTRVAALTALRIARKEARKQAADEIKRIDELDKEIRIGARALTECFWGTYLDIEAGHQQRRVMPLYEDDGVTPNDPHFIGWQGDLHDPRIPWEGQLGVQLQGGLKTADAFKCEDTRIKFERNGLLDGDPRYGRLSIHIGSNGRDPVWATWPAKMLHCAGAKRHAAVVEIPDAAVWKWVRVSVRHEGRRPQWSCEITVDGVQPHPRRLDKSLSGAVAIAFDWYEKDGSIVVANWVDSYGERGSISIPASVVSGIHKPDGIRAVRDIISDELKKQLTKGISSASNAPQWLKLAGATMHLWKSPRRMYELEARWRKEAPDVATASLTMLRTWAKRDLHLWDYEAGARGEATRERRETFRLLAVDWSRRYKTVLVSDRDLSLEARWGADSDLRFTAAPSELRTVLRNAFGDDAVDTKWPRSKDEHEDWCECVCAAWMAGGARDGVIFAKVKEKVENAWAARKAKAAAKRAEADSAREPVRKASGS